MNPRTTRAYSTLTGLPTRGPMPPMVSVILPIERTNLVTNPSIELATTNYTAIGGSIARSATQQYHGTYSLAVTPGAGTADGAYYGSIALTSGVIYAYSAKVKGIAGIPYKISLASTVPTDLSVFQFVGTGRWQWVYGYYLETSSTNRRVYFTKNGSANVGIFYVDGVQVEAINAGETVSTYIDGDQLGLLVNQQPPAYLWTGTPHASTSIRSALTRAGGSVVNLSLFNFLLTGIVGLGMAVPNNVSIPYTVLDGARYLRTIKPPRTLALAGRVQADDWYTYQQSLSDLRAAFDRDLVPLQQPLLLQVEPQDECGTVIGDFATVPCIYAGGLEGDDGNLPIGDVAPTFTMYVPFLSGGGAGAALTVQQTVTNANFLLYRSPLGVWSALSTGLNASANVIAVHPTTGVVYIGGSFTNAGSANGDFIVSWNGTAFSSLGTGMDAMVNAIAFDAAGNLYAGGDFTTAGGVAAAHIAKWDGSVWTALGTGLTGGINPTCNALIVNTNGTLYVGGKFTDAGGSGADNLAAYNLAAGTWSVVGSAAAITAPVNALAIDPQNRLYIGGNFVTAITRWNGSTYSPLGTGMDSNVSALLWGPNNLLYAGGSFTTAGGVAAPWVAAWNGASWSPLGAGADNAVTHLFLGSGGALVYASGDLTTADGISLPDRIAKWTGTNWMPLDVDLPGAAAVGAGVALADGSLYLGFKASGSAVSAALTAVPNNGPTATYPILTIKGPTTGTARVYQIINYTTGFGVWLNYTINAGETATFVFDPTNPTFTSDFRLMNLTGDLSATILPGSSPQQMYLAPGVNQISFFAGSSTVTATLRWQTRYNGIADLVN